MFSKLPGFSQTACRVLKTKLTTSGLTYNSPARKLSLSHTVIHPGNGRSESLLIVHGALGNKFNFNTVGKMLGERTGIKIIACDLRNHGESPHSDEMSFPVMSEDLLELMDTLDIDRCSLLGHSLGGRVAMFTALLEPQQIDKLVIVDVSPGKETERNVAGIQHYIQAMRNLKLDSGMRLSQARKTADDQLREVIPDSNIRSFVLTNLKETPSGGVEWRINIDAILKHINNLYFLPGSDQLKPFYGKALFLGGGSSPYILPKDHPHIKRLFPNAKIEHVPGCGHWVHSEKPKEFVSAVSNFLI